MDRHMKAIEAACRAHDDVAGEAVNKAAMQAGIAAFLRECTPDLGPDSTSRLMAGDFRQIACDIADELERP